MQSYSAGLNHDPDACRPTELDDLVCAPYGSNSPVFFLWRAVSTASELVPSNILLVLSVCTVPYRLYFS